MGLGKRYWPARLATLSDAQRAPINDYVVNLQTEILSGVGLFLWGANSTGKTYIASAFCKYAWGKYRVTSYLVTAPDLYASMKRDQPAHEGSEETVLQRVSSVRFLVIDDLGREYRAQSGFMEAELSSLLRNRNRDKKTTIITSNLDPPMIKKVYGQSFAELLKESLMIKRIVGSNWREVKADKFRKSDK